MAKKATATKAAELDTEVATRSRDPFENLYMGVIRTNDPLLLERGNGSSELYRDLKRDGKVYGCMQKLALALISRPWQVDPIEDTAKGKADAKTVQDILEHTNFDQITRDFLDGVIASPAVGEVVWTVRDGMVVPKAIKKRATRRFVYVQADDQQPPALQMLTRENMLTGVPLPERKFIVHRVNPEDDNPYGTGLGLQLYWPVFFKRKGIVAWNKLNDRFGTPTPWGKYPRNAGPKEKSTLFDALKAFSNDGVVMTPEGTMIELLEAKLTGSVTTQQALVEYMDDWISEVILGTEPRTKGGGALAAASKERAEVREDLVKAHADLLSDTLNDTLIEWICAYNGLEPCRVYRVFPKKEGTKEDAERDKILGELGYELSEESVQAKYGDGFTKKPEPATPPAVPGAPVPPVPGAKPPPAGGDGKPPANFAERDPVDPADKAQIEIDRAAAAVPETELQAAMAGLMEPLLAAIEGADSFEAALAAAEAAYPRMDKTKLQALLAHAMFGAEAFGREAADA
jgi:phage gp29-like protein